MMLQMKKMMTHHQTTKSDVDVFVFSCFPSCSPLMIFSSFSPPCASSSFVYCHWQCCHHRRPSSACLYYCAWTMIDCDDDDDASPFCCPSWIFHDHDLLSSGIAIYSYGDASPPRNDRDYDDHHDHDHDDDLYRDVDVMTPTRRQVQVLHRVLYPPLYFG